MFCTTCFCGPNFFSASKSGSLGEKATEGVIIDDVDGFGNVDVGGDNVGCIIGDADGNMVGGGVVVTIANVGGVTGDAEGNIVGSGGLATGVNVGCVSGDGEGNII